MQIEDINIQELLPQKAPLLMIDRLVHFDNVFTKTTFCVKKDNIFCKNGHLMEAGIIENMAQTCAARIGYINKVLLNGEVKIGFIGAIKNLKIFDLPKINTTLETEIEILNEVFAMTLVRVLVMSDECRVASCEMKISISDI